MSKLWDSVLQQIKAGNLPPVFITSDGRLALDGPAAVLPLHVAKLYPPSIIEAAQQRRAEFDAKQKARQELALQELQNAQKEQERVINQYGKKRCWRLCGMFIEDRTQERYTYHQIAQWIDCEAYPLRHDHPAVSIVCERGDEGDYYIDVSDCFANPCNDKVPPQTFHNLAHRLALFVRKLQANLADNN